MSEQPASSDQDQTQDEAQDQTHAQGQDQDQDQSDQLADGQETIGASAPGASDTAQKDPSQWVTGDEPMTGAQKSYLDTLAREAGETLPADQTKAEASQNIDRLQQETGRGASGSGSSS